MAEQAQTLPASIQGLSAVELFDGDADVVERVLAEVEDAARSIVPDISTDKGRRAVASLAAKVARSKTFLDGLGKDHVAELKRRAGEVDARRRTIRDRLDALKAEVRQPLTDYEQAEADRQAALQWRIDALSVLPPDDVGVGVIADRIAKLEAAEIGTDYAERAAEARQVRAATLYELSRRLERVREREAAEAKAEAERQERERREREEREQRIAAEAAERARREAEQAATAERERAARAVAESQARAERDAAEAKARIERAEHEAEQAAERERARIAAEQARERAEAERRAADREHQAQVNREVLADLCDLGLAEADAKRLIGAIARGQVAHVRIDY